MDAAQNMNQRDRSKSISMEIISKTLQDNFDPIELLYIGKDDSDNFYTVKFLYESVFQLDNIRFVLKGKIDRGQKGYVNGALEYNFNENKFYDVKLWGKSGIRRISSLTLINAIPQNEQKCKDVLGFLSNYLYPNEGPDTKEKLKQ
jgi:hypothetical protein